MKKGLRYLLTVLIAALLGLLLVLAGSLESASRREQTVDRMTVSFEGEGDFLTEEEVKDLIRKDYGVWTGQRTDSVDLKKIETILAGHSVIRRSACYLTRDSLLHVDVSLRRPAIRFVSGNDSWYADKDGHTFPAQGHIITSVPVISGPLPQDEKWVENVLEMVRFLEGSRIWHGRIAQMQVDSRGELVLLPAEGKERFLFGTPNGYADKFSRMEDYYRYVLPARGEGYYKTVNVKFDRQLVCRK